MPPRTHVTWRGLWRAGDRPGSSAGSLCLSGAGILPLLLLDGSSHLPLLISLASLLCPQAPVQPGGGFGRQLSRLPVPEWVGQSPSAPLPLLPEDPSCLPLLISPASLLCFQDPRGLEGPLDREYRPGSSAGSPAQVGQAIALRSSPAPPGESLPPASPDIPGLRGADPVWPPLLLPSQSPCVLQVHFGVPPISLGIRVPHQRPAGTLVVGRC